MVLAICQIILTHLPWTKWPKFRQMTFSNAFSWMKIIEFRVKFHWNLFPGVQSTISQHWFRWWLGAKQATRHYLNQCWPSSLSRICGTRGDELRNNVLVQHEWGHPSTRNCYDSRRNTCSIHKIQLTMAMLWLKGTVMINPVKILTGQRFARLVGPIYRYTLTEIRSWISNCIHHFLWNVINQTHYNFND